MKKTIKTINEMRSKLDCSSKEYDCLYNLVRSLNNIDFLKKIKPLNEDILRNLFGSDFTRPAVLVFGEDGCKKHKEIFIEELKCYLEKQK